ncbi:MAG: hypothetical protein KAS73_05800, partial [Candidatus Sabulitectum sp.]|nr:hypothetical protein [Candidatus Sabulitectum sp.]
IICKARIPDKRKKIKISDSVVQSHAFGLSVRQEYQTKKPREEKRKAMLRKKVNGVPDGSLLFDLCCLKKYFSKERTACSIH